MSRALEMFPTAEDGSTLLPRSKDAGSDGLDDTAVKNAIGILSEFQRCPVTALMILLPDYS
jgi:hypothetical protein